MTWFIIISLILGGIILLLLEVLVIPGTTVVGLAGAGLIGTGIFFTFADYGVLIGSLVLFATLVVSIVSVVMALRSKTWKRAALNAEIDGKVNVINAELIHVGDEGLTISRLNPVGKALFNGEYYEVVSKDNLIDPNTAVMVVKIEGNKIIVKQKS